MTSTPGRFMTVIFLAAIAAVTVVVGLRTVMQSGHATGWDGYYYLVQVRTLVEDGRMHSPEYSPVYIPLLAFHALTGDYLNAYRLSSVLILLVFVLSVYVLSRSLLMEMGAGGGTVRLAALLSTLLALMSPSLNYFFTQFPKNLLGFAFFLLFASSVISVRSRRTRGRKRLIPHAAGCVVLFLCAFFTHRFSAVLSIVFLVLYLGPGAVRVLITGRGSGKKLTIMLSSVLATLLLLLIAGKLPLAPSLRDLQRITGDLSARPVLVPLAFVRTFGLFRLSVPWLAEIALASVLPVAMTVALLTRKLKIRIPGGYRALLLISLVGLFPFLRFSLTGLGYRLLFGSLLLLPVVSIPFLLPAARAMEKAGTGTSFTVLSMMLGLSLLTASAYDPELHDPPYSCYEELSDGIVQSLSGRDYELIVAHRSLAEVITFRHGLDALPWSPEERFARDRVWRVTAGISRSEVSWYLGPETADSFYFRLSGDYGLLREDMWECLLDSVSGDPAMMQAIHNWRNPMEMRPSYLVGDAAGK